MAKFPGAQTKGGVGKNRRRAAKAGGTRAWRVARHLVVLGDSQPPRLRQGRRLRCMEVQIQEISVKTRGNTEKNMVNVATACPTAKMIGCVLARWATPTALLNCQSGPRLDNSGLVGLGIHAMSGDSVLARIWG
eukprot:gene23138-biopygen16322